MIKNLLVMQENLVRSLGQEDPMEKEMATQGFLLGNPMDTGAWWAIVHGVTRVGHDLVSKPHHQLASRHGGAGETKERGRTLWVCR